MLVATNITLEIGARTLLEDASITLAPGDRVALVGPNGSGKTTLLNALAGQRKPDKGTITRVGDTQVGYLEQETEHLRGQTVLESVLAATPSMQQAGQKLRELEDNPDADPVELGEAHHLFESLGGYSAEADVRKILAGLAFKQEAMDEPTDALSGGWLVRVALARLLVSGAEVMLLDEPTNHLDLESVRWLEGFLRNAEAGILLVSHDRDLINNVANRIVEIEDEQLNVYEGDFEAFIEERALRRAQAEAAAKHQAKRVAEIEQFVERFRYKASKARQVQSRVKMLEKMDAPAQQKRDRKSMRVRFPPAPRSGRVTCELTDVGFNYPGGAAVYKDISAHLERGEKVALVGPNGAGKTTLLKLIAGDLKPTSGTRKLGHNVEVGVFAQRTLETLNPNHRVIESMSSALPPDSKVGPRDLLGQFLFSGDDVDKPVRVLSGGEKTRLAMARILAAPFNLLCLDEPTNHLDMASRDILEEALISYEGSIVLITHDRHLIRSVANVIFAVADGEVTRFPGDYESWLYHVEKRGSEAEAAVAAAVGAGGPTVNAKQRRKEAAAERERTANTRKRMKQVETELAGFEADRATLEAKLGQADFYTTGGDEVAVTLKRHGEVKDRITRLELEWDKLASELQNEN